MHLIDIGHLQKVVAQMHGGLILLMVILMLIQKLLHLLIHVV